jgi:arylsulfatase A-like enzyme
MRLTRIIPKSIRRSLRFSPMINHWLEWRNRDKDSRNRNAYLQRHRKVERLFADLELSPPRRCAAKHIVFVVIDCLRSDHMSLYGYPRRTTPSLDRIAENGAVFTDAVSPSSWTYPSVASMVSGLYPHHHGGMHVEEPRNFEEGMMPQCIREEVLFLQEMLSCFGFHTYLHSTIDPAEYALSGSFQETSVSPFSRAENLLWNYGRWLNDHSSVSTFAYLQLGDLHEPVYAPEPFRSHFGAIPAIPKLERWDYTKDVNPGATGFERYQKYRVQLYDSSLLYVDACLQQLFEQLENLSLLDEMLIVVTADHGEEMWDHLLVERGEFFDPRPAYGIGHGHHLWQELVAVPLIVIGPEIPARESHRRVSLVDLTPTVLQYYDVSGWEAIGLDGKDAFADLDGRVILSEATAFGYEKKAIYKGNHKLYFSKGDDVCWVFDLAEDEEERQPLHRPELVESLMQHLPQAAGNSGREMTADSEIIQRLRALGYVE